MSSHPYSRNGLAMTEHFEGLSLTAYRDVAGVWTIGYGHTGPDVTRGRQITQAQAAALLTADLASAVACVNHAVKVSINQDQFDALVDFTFNLGRGALLASTLLRKLNAGDIAGAQAEFARWDKADGKPVAALAERRAAETKLFAPLAAAVCVAKTDPA